MRRHKVLAFDDPGKAVQLFRIIGEGRDFLLDHSGANFLPPPIGETDEVPQRLAAGVAHPLLRKQNNTG